MTTETTSSAWLSNHLFRRADHLLLIDVRSRAQYDRGHILGAINLSCTSGLIMRRLKRGQVSLERLIHTEAEKARFAISRESTVVLYDSGPSTASAELMTVLCNRLSSCCRYLCTLGDGYVSFSQQFPELCETSAESRASEIEGDSPCLSLSFLRIGSLSSPSSISSSELATPSSVSPRVLKGDPAQVLPHLYLGDEKNAADIDTLIRYNIGFILNVTDNLPNTFENNKELNIEYLRISVQDSHKQSLTEHFEAASTFIDRAERSGRRVLVHCVAGISRSVTVTIAYLMIRHQQSFNSAYDFVKQRKENISPNFSFLGQLLDLERKLGMSNIAMVPLACQPKSPTPLIVTS